MKKFRRYFRYGDICFITNVTYRRIPVLIEHIDLFQKAQNNVKSNTPFELIAWIILPDHHHFIIDPCSHNVSKIIQRFKMSFASLYRKTHSKNSGRVWQNRFWDHIIRDEDDLRRHIDYIHFNPVKHGIVKSPFEWKHSSVFQFYPEEEWHFDLELVEKFESGDFGE